MIKVLANDGISQTGIDTLKSAGFEVITQKVAQEQLANVINEKNIKDQGGWNWTIHNQTDRSGIGCSGQCYTTLNQYLYIQTSTVLYKYNMVCHVYMGFVYDLTLKILLLVSGYQSVH